MLLGAWYLAILGRFSAAARHLPEDLEQNAQALTP